MSEPRTDRKYKNIVDRVDDQVGADISRDKLEVAIAAVDVAGFKQNLTQVGGEPQSAVDVANKIDKLEDALASVGNDELRVDIGGSGNLDVDLAENSFGTITVTDDGSLAISAYNGGTLPTEQQSPVGVEDSNGTQIDPLSNSDVSSVTDSTSTAATNVPLQLGEYRKDVDWFVDVSGSATLTVEVRVSGGTWRQFDTVSYSSATTEVEQYSTSFAEIRARVDSNLNTLEGSAKGI